MKLPRLCLALLLASGVLCAQEPVAPTNTPIGKVRGEDLAGYNIVNSFETGYRFSSIDGDLGKYRSDVNYRNGIRLLGSTFSAYSKDGKGRYFDEILLNTLGLGNDPYQSAVLRLQKNRWYRYDMLWRLNEYFNPGLTISAGQHLLDTRRRLQDHDLVIHPQSDYQLRFGYTRNSQTGPGLSTTQLFDARGDEFPLFANVRRMHNEYRVGGDARLGPIKFSLLQTLHYFKDESSEILGRPSAGNNPLDRITARQFVRNTPYSGASPLSRGNFSSDPDRWISVNGRFTYVGGRRSFAQDELATGTDRFGGAQNRQLLIAGTGTRPVTAGDFLLQILPSKKLSITNNTSYHSTRMVGNSTLVELNNATGGDRVVNFQHLGIQRVSNSSEANYRINKKAGFFGGYHFAERSIRSVESAGVAGFEAFPVRAEQTNRLQAGVFGIRLTPVNHVTLAFDAEVGRTNRPFYAVSEKDYHAFAARVQYKTKKFRLGSNYKLDYNFNSVSLANHSSRSRTYSANTSWIPGSWFSLDASYSRIHFDSLSALNFFATTISSGVIGGSSRYISNINAFQATARFAILKRADLLVGISSIQDAGDGRSQQIATDPIQAILNPAQTFPLVFQSPSARISIRLQQRLRANVGWQYYRYRQDFPLLWPNQDYRANTGFVSLQWSL